MKKHSMKISIAAAAILAVAGIARAQSPSESQSDLSSLSTVSFDEAGAQNGNSNNQESNSQANQGEQEEYGPWDFEYEEDWWLYYYFGELAEEYSDYDEPPTAYEREMYGAFGIELEPENSHQIERVLDINRQWNFNTIEPGGLAYLPPINRNIYGPGPNAGSYVTPAYPPVLMFGLTKIPLGNSSLGQDLIDSGINVSGYFEAGYTADLSGRPDNEHSDIPGRIFDSNYGNHIALNGIDLSIARGIDLADPAFRSRGWDIGGAMEWTYGFDSDFTHSNGLNFYHSWVNNTDPYPLYQFNLQQLYGDVAFPTCNNSAVQFQFGQFNSLLGYETIQAPGNAFYSHSFAFNYAIPHTNTGALVQYVPDVYTNAWSFEAGVTRGWNQSLNDNNTAIDFTGRIQWRPDNQNLFQTNFIVGPEGGGTTFDGFHYSDNAHYTWALEGTYEYFPNWNPQLSFAADAVLGYSYNGLWNNFNGGYVEPPGMPGGTVMWYDTSLYQYYKINDYLSWNNREEYYYDGGGFTTQGLGQSMPSLYTHGNSISYGEFTTGFKITPFPNNPYLSSLYLRPELRLDMADHAVLTNDKHYQTTLAMDVVYQF